MQPAADLSLYHESTNRKRSLEKCLRAQLQSVRAVSADEPPEQSHRAAIKNHEWSYAAWQRRAQSYATTLPPSSGATPRSAAPQRAPRISLESYTPPLNRRSILDGVASTH